MTIQLIKSLLFSALFVLATSILPGAAYAINASVVQELSGPFDNPEGSVVGLDGTTVFVSSAAAADSVFQFPENAGYISKLVIGGGGQLNLVEKSFVSNLTRPWGMGVLPIDVGTIPAGTVFVGTGTSLSGTIPLATDIVAFDPDDGSEVGRIKTGLVSAFELISEGPVLAINALAFDAHGNLYFTDTGLGWNAFSPILPVRQGVWKVPVERLEDMLAGSINPADIQFCYIAGAPDGIEVSPDGKLYVSTVGVAAVGFGPPLYDPYQGAFYLLTDADFDAGYPLNPPLFAGLGALDGLVFTPHDGTLLSTEITLTSDIVAIKRGKLIQAEAANRPREDVTFLGVPNLSGPADISVADVQGDIYVIIPEHTSGGKTLPKDDQVTVIRLRGTR